MTPLEFLVQIKALESVAWVLPYVVLVLVLANLLTRQLAHRNHKRAAENDEEIDHYTPHVGVSMLLLLASFLFMVFHPHGGMVLSVLVVGMVISDVFEVEARQVEARNDMAIEAPKSAIVASVVVLLYVLFQSLFWVIDGPWKAIVG